jgi:ATP-binding cassette, subfamily B, bacterial
VGIAAAFLAVALLTQVSVVAETYVAEDVGWRTTNTLRADLTRHLLMLDDSFHAEHGSGELIERIDGDVSAIAGFFARFVVHVAGSALLLVGVLVVLWRQDWRIGALLTGFAVGAAVYMARGGGFVGSRAREARLASADLSAFLEERLAGLPDIKANGADGYTLRRLHERLRDRFHTGRRSVLAASLFTNAINTMFVAGAGASLALGVVLHDRGALTVGAVFMVVRYTTMLRDPIERLSRHMNSLQQASGGIVRVRELLATSPRVVDGEGVPVPAGALSLELDHVSFAYDAEPVLSDVSLRLEPGQVLGLLGRTGSGKTTISRLLLRLHDVSEGSIRLGGVDVRQVGLDDLRGRVALVTQDVQLFAGTLRDNVTLYDPTVGDCTARGGLRGTRSRPLARRAARRVGHDGRCGRPRAVRRRVPAGGAGPGLPEGPRPGGAGRGIVAPRPAHGAAGAAGGDQAARGPDGDRDRPPAGDGGPGGRRAGP